ncbi:trans-sulfuration enzyme family protein [Ornithinimicrobium sufpigmenti]|uniref:trans-sulfuration enzyme family protein n=1 Tax=Ornithinimicrobium sufpigmenti TaxID=2508882 RepID=UPI001035ADCE|nr:MULTISPECIES: PLP-dependent aspartate aminotransferase family protein [unclassified Ornithinimicrobium]
MTNATDHEQLTAATRAVALGRPERAPGAPVNVPVAFTSTYVADGEINYARTSNPTWEALEEVLGSLEGGSARVFGSGLAAVSAVISLVPIGGVVVAPQHAYNGTTGILGERSAAGALTVRTVPADDVEAIVTACAGADLLLLESPTNPMMEVTDVPAVLRELAERYGDRRPVVVCDNTFATPLVQQPLSWGADAVVHSATKYLAGHSDVLLGAVVVSPQRADLAARLHTHRTLHGAIPGPMEAWLVLRGIRTLSVRLERATASAREIAERLGEHPAVGRVRYPGFGAMLSIEVGSEETAEAVCARTRLWTHSTSLGGVESQIERRRRHPLEVPTVPVDLIRLSVGIEDVEDLWTDLDQALRSGVPVPAAPAGQASAATGPDERSV